MATYILRRLLLMIPTLIGVIIITFFISEFVPGGPLDQVQAILKGRGSALYGSGELSYSANQKLKQTAQDLQAQARLKRLFGLHHNRVERLLRTFLWFSPEPIMSSLEISNNTTETFYLGKQKCTLTRDNNQYSASYTTPSTISNIKKLATIIPIKVVNKEGHKVIYKKETLWQSLTNKDNWHGFFILKFGKSLTYNKTVVQLVKERLPISISLGVFSFFITYICCIILGIRKAVCNGESFDIWTSLLIILGYSIPGFVLAIFLIVFFGPGDSHLIQIIPLDGGLTSHGSSGNADLNWLQRVLDYLHHLIAPVLCLSIGSFAVLTILTKNSILENMHSLYATAARARGLSESKVLYKHVLRNALIPLITGFPAGFLAMFFTGSLLIEKIFGLNGLGLLGYTAVMERDFPVIMGSLFIFTILGLVGRLLTDISYVLVDPRISFEGHNNS